MRKTLVLAAVLTAQALTAGDRVWNNYPETRADVVQLRTTAIAIGIDRAKRGAVAWIKSCDSGTDFVAAEPSRPLFRLKFVSAADPSAKPVELTPAEAGGFACETFDRQLRLVYTDFPGGVCSRVEVTLSTARHDNVISLDLAVSSGDGWKHVWDTFPDLPLAAATERLDDVHGLVRKGRALLCRKVLDGRRVGLTAYDLDPGETADAALVASLFTTRGTDGEEGDAGLPRVLFLGNSINGTGPANRWDGDWGMCASWPRKDYVHQVVKGLSRRYGGKVSWRRQNLAQWERNLATYDVPKKLAASVAFRPDLVILALGENVPGFKTEADRDLFRRKLTELGRLFKAPGVRLVVRSPFWARDGHREIQRAVADELGATFVDLRAFGEDAKWQALPTSTDIGVARHPGDAGMRRIADEILKAVLPEADEPLVRRVGVINWDASVPSWTYFGKAVTRSLGPEKYRDRTPYYAEPVGKDQIDYRHRTLAEYETEMQYAIDAGIDYFAYCWYDLNPPPGDASHCAGKLHEITFARRNHVKSALRDRLHLCAILVTGHPYSDQALTSLALEMREPWYEKADGRPLVFTFAKTDLIGRLRTICRAVGAPEPYVVSMLWYRSPKDWKPFAEADAYSAYGCPESARSYGELADLSLEWHAGWQRDGVKVMPHFETGWDPSPRLDHPAPWAHYPTDKPWAPPATAEEWLSGARKLKAWISANRAACPTGHVLAFAWNEFEEGGWICPTLGADGKPDVSRVKAFAAVVRLLKGTAGE